MALPPGFSGFHPEEGFLKHKGYTVGAKGLPERQRREVLKRCVRDPASHQYFAEWGKPESRERMAKLLRTLRALTVLDRRRKSEAYREAAEEREADLEWLCKWLYDEYRVFSSPWKKSVR